MNRFVNILVICFLLGITVGCKTDKNSEGNPGTETAPAENIQGRTQKQADGLTLLKGEFLYYADAAVLQTHREVYGVVVDEGMHRLNDMVKEYKKEDTDMVPVEIRGKIIPKPEGEEGWPLRVEIKEILKVSKPDDNSDKIITIGQ